MCLTHDIHRVEDILSAGGVQMSKAARLDPLVDADYVTLAARLAKKLREDARNEEADGFEEALGLLDGVATATPEEQRKKIGLWKAAFALLALGGLVAGSLDSEITNLAIATRLSAIERFSLEVPGGLQASDLKSLLSLAESQGGFTKEEYLRRAVLLERLIKDMLEAGAANGIGSESLETLIKQALRTWNDARDDVYWGVVANVGANRVRGAVLLHAFSDAGVERVRFVSVMDGQQCVTCEFMNGRVATVAKLTGVLDAAEDLRDPDDIRDALPWMGHDTSGVYYRKGGEKKYLLDDVAGDVMVDEGLFIIPVHALCRCWYEPAQLTGTAATR